ncbi:uncharacterized protein LOC111380760 [Olea europaea var. sylvestris]|uniref:uncharacterized protein LOC111380758 n=1 Tax=Olea europaea var. sylvestris TaxID=158386 RepID=UPI000C1D5959|nr:uncharacterized protein LOC111380758 [Olea europaea var. sylvestris]XP_022860162.1 uncharacterized protein LOC111380759 [Olea europaea var. sylvestris]XP_022860163.1 uncharacterized protein LOC111380760 [Olea europaea var. sylvestris]
MERSEPTLVPEWLKNGGSLTGGSITSHSESQATSNLARNKSSVHSNGHDSRRSYGSDRTTSSYFHRSSSSNGSGRLMSSGSFGRNHPDRDWERDINDSCDKGRPVLGDYRHRDFSGVFGNDLPSKYERDGVRRSQSMISGKRGETWSKKVVTDLSSANRHNNGLLTEGSPVGSANKAAFERDFPSLGAEGRPITPEVGRVPSPVLSNAIQSLPFGTSTVKGCEKWTSALAEVPLIVGINGIGTSSLQQSTSSNSSSGTFGTSSGLNMAETVSQSSTHAQTTTQSSAGASRQEELAFKQSKQLIPMTPSMPKTLVLNSSDKQKSKVGQQYTLASSLPVSHSPRGAPEKSDISKTSNVGKLHVLKPVRERNVVSPSAKDNLSPTSGGKILNSSLLVAPSGSGSAVTRGPPNNPIIPGANRKPILTVSEKKSTSQAQSRNEFFNLMRKKSLANSSLVPDASTANPSPVHDPSMANSMNIPDHGATELISVLDKLGELPEVVASNTPRAVDALSSISLSESHMSVDRGESTCNTDACNGQKYVSNGKESLSIGPIFPEEEAFLRSMGWEENADEGGLTEEEISAFYRYITNKYIDPRTSLKILRVKPKFLLTLGSEFGTGDNISSGLSSSDTILES